MIKSSKIILAILLCIYHLSGYSKLSEPAFVRIDSIHTESYGYQIVHYHKVSKEIYNNLLFDKSDLIFSNQNYYSRIIIKNGYTELDIPTIPLSHIIIMENKGIVIGLSNFIVSPYSIVIYSLKTGDLLYKSKIGMFELKLSEDELHNLSKSYPPLKNALSNTNSFVINNEYFIEMNNEIINILGREVILEKHLYSTNRFFPKIGSTTASSYDENNNFYFKKYVGFFNNSNPIYDLITIGPVPYLLILNAEDGEKVHIPLITNCIHFLK